MPGKEIEKKLDKQTLKSLCELASTESDRKLMQSVATWGMSAKQARKTYGIDDHSSKTRQVQEAMARAEDIRQSTMELAQLEETALLQSLGISDVNSSESDTDGSGNESEYLESGSDCEDSICESGDETNCIVPKDKVENDLHLPQPSNIPDEIRFDPDSSSKYVAAVANPAPSNETLLSWLRENKLNWFSFFHELQEYLKHYNVEVLNQVLLEFTEYLSVSDLSEEEEQLVEMSRQAFLEFMRRQPLSIEDEVFSESDTEIQTPCIKEMQSLTDQAGKEAIQAVRHAIKQRAKRIAAKQVASQSILKRKIPQRASRIIKQHPTIGTDIEDFVKSKRVGADAWRRTGVLTFDGTRTRGKKVTYKGIQDHLQEKYGCKISYGTVVQLCVIRSKRRISARRYRGVTKITCRKSRKGFAVKLNPDAHWSSAFYKGLDFIQLKDGRNKVLLNRDDQAGFRLDTTFTHRQGKCITIDNIPSLTTRTDFVNSYPSLLQTTSYLFMESETTEKACIGVVKPHFTFPKNPTQHYADLEMLESKLPSHLEERPIECIRVDGAGDEGPGHLEVQFLWTERHIKQQRICTIVSTRHSGGSYLNEVELMNGCIAKAHSNLFIPSTLSGTNFNESGIDRTKLAENVDIATDVYIDRADGAPCCGTTLQLYKGAKDEMLRERRPSLLVFLRGNAKEKEQLRTSNPELYQYFESVWRVRKQHMNKNLAENYVFMLNLCHQPDCPHPLCGSEAVKSHSEW